MSDGNSEPEAPSNTSNTRPASRTARRRPRAPIPSSPGWAKRATPETAFPLIPTAQRTALPTHHNGDVPSRKQSLDPHERPQRPTTWAIAVNDDEDQRSCSQATILRDRLHAAGMNKTIVGAQLFPTVSGGSASNQQPPRSARRGGSSRGPEPSGSGPEHDIKARPLNFTVKMQQTMLVPTRPTSSAVVKRQRIISRTPNSARGHVDPPEDLPREPLSARDRYYADQRASTAPSTEVSGRRHRRQGQPKSPPRHSAHANPGAERDCQLPSSRRLTILAPGTRYQTFTEAIFAHLSAVQGSQNSSVGMERDSFLYLRRVDANPYNLVVATHAEINPKDYYTVSRTGVTHFTNNSADFVPLEKFEREHYQYSLLVAVSCHRGISLWPF